MSLFKYKNPETGEWQPVSVIQGHPGKTAYEYAQDAGYTGTEAEFSENLAAEIPTKTSQLTNDSGFITGYTETDPTVPSWAKQSAKPTYTASEVGADPVGTAEDKVTVHNTDATSHNDIRIELKALSDRLAAFFDSDDATLDELSEIVEYIQNNKVLIDSITTSKVSVVDVIDNLVTNVSNKPLSAAQGVVLKGLIDSITVPTKVSQLENDSGYLMEHQDISGKLDASKLPEAVETALENAKESGAFNGKNGVTPHIGGNGNWYIGSTDTGIEARGPAGAAGRGIKSIVLTSGNGAAGTTDTYTITYTDGTTSTFTVRNGSNGTNGKTPVLGTDYFTPDDKAEIIQSVIDQMGLMVLGQMDGDNTITLTETLPDGTYTLRCINADGSATVLCEFAVGNTGPAYINLADPTSADWLTNKRINSSKNIVDVTEAQRGDKTVVVTNFISIAGVSKLHIKGLDIVSDLVNGSSTQNYGRVYDYNGATIIGSSYSPESGINSKTHYTYADYDSSVLIFDIATMLKDWGGAHTSATHVRLGGILTGAAADVIITADEPIV